MQLPYFHLDFFCINVRNLSKGLHFSILHVH